MPNALTPDHWARIKSVFLDALEIPDQGRRLFLDSVCGDDAVVRQEVERLIEHHSADPEFLESPLTACRRIARSLSEKNIFEVGDLVNGRFQVERFIGAGGMGEVYEVSDNAIGGVRIALKTIRSGFDGDKDLEMRFRREVEIARRITHPNVCRIHDLFETRVNLRLFGGGRAIVFLTMELLAGESLAERLARAGRMAEKEAWPLLRDIAQALGAAHQQGVVHRDLKSSNVMVVSERGGSLKAVLTDFGLALLEQRQALEADESQIAGTPDYMAPEQLEGGEIGFPSDIFALGVVMYEMLTNKRPFPASSTLVEARLSRRGQPVPPRHHVPGLSAQWESAILKCLERDPADRFKAPADLLGALESPRHSKTITRRVAIAAGLVGVCAWLGRGKFFSPSITSLAVLPFENLSGDLELQYFAEGLAGDLVPMLTRFRGVRIVAPSASELGAISGRQAIGKALHVDTILSGSVQREGTRITVAAELAGVNDGMPVWSGRYSEEVQTLARVRLNLSMEIAGALQPRLPKAQLAGMAGPQSENADAYNLYLLGKHYATFRSNDSLKRSEEYLSQSIARDPKFAPAYAALSDVCSIRAGQAGCPPAEYILKAVQGAETALHLDPQSGEAHSALGFAYGRRWDWQNSEREFRAAIQLNPAMALAHYRYSGLHSVLGRSQSAIAEVLLAQDLDPLSPVVSAGYGAFLYRARRFADALQQLQKTLRLLPDSAAALSTIGQIYEASGSFDQAITAHRKSLETGPGYYFRYAARLGHALAQAGWRTEALALASEIENALGEKHYSPMAVGTVYLGLKDFDKTYYWYTVAIQQRDPSMEVLLVDPANDPIRGEARFVDMLRQIGLQ